MYIDKYNLDYSGINFTDELHTDVGSTKFTLNHDTIHANSQFTNGENIDIWTDSGQSGTQLTEGTDYEFVNEDTDLSSEVTGTIYINIRVINSTYETGDLYFTYESIGDYVDAEDINSIGNKLENLTANNIKVDDSNINITTSGVQDAVENTLNNFTAGGDIDLNGYDLINVDNIKRTNQVYGLEWNQTRDSYTRLEDAQGLSVPDAQTAGYKYSDFDDIFPWNNMRRCNLSDDGTVNAYYGDPAYTTDGSNGQIMVEIPKFYYKTELDTSGDRIFRWYISSEPLDGFSVHPAFVRDGVEKDYIYIGAFEGHVNASDVMESIAGVQPSTEPNVSDGALPSFRTYAQNRGTGWNIRDYYTTHAAQMLYLIEYGNFNTQQELGRSIVDKDSGSGNESENTGATSGNQSHGDPDDGYTAISYRGIENFYGNIWEWTDGININDYDVYVASENFISDKYTDNYSLLGTVLSSSDTYITDIIENSFLAKSGGGTSTTYLADNWWVDSGQRVARFGGYWNFGSRVGGFCWYLYSSSSDADRSTGSRLLFWN